MKKAILAILMLATCSGAAYAQAPEPYRSEVILYRCGDTITPTTAMRIQDNYYKINMTRRALIRASYIAMAAGDPARIKNYCDNLLKAAEKLR